MPDEVYMGLQIAHMTVFSLLLFNKEWRITAGLLLVSAIFYYNAGAHILTLGEPMYLIRAFVDVCFGLAIFLSPVFIKWIGLSRFPGHGGILIQPLILALFTVYHLAAFLFIKVGFYSFFVPLSLFGSPEISLYIWVTNALNVAQIVVALGVVGDIVVRFARGVGDAIKYSGRGYGAGRAFVERTQGYQKR